MISTIIFIKLIDLRDLQLIILKKYLRNMKTKYKKTK